MTDAAGPVIYRFELSGVGATDLDVVVEENKARAKTAGTAPANLSASCDTDTFVLLMYGRFSLESAVAAGRMTAEGNQGLMTGFDQWLAGH
jgi:putative sterol carrier protein